MFSFCLLIALCVLMYLFRNKLKSLFKQDVANIENKINQDLNPPSDSVASEVQSSQPAAPASVEQPKQ